MTKKTGLLRLAALAALAALGLPGPSLAGLPLNPWELHGTWMASEDGIGIVLRLECGGFVLQMNELELGGSWLCRDGDLILHYNSGTVHAHSAAVRDGRLHLGGFMRLMRIGEGFGLPRRPRLLPASSAPAPLLDKDAPAA